MRSLQIAVVAAAFIGAAFAQTDADILNYALNLECLEANYYGCAVNGMPLSGALAGANPGTVSGCMKANLDGPTMQYAMELYENEMTHVNDLRTALGSAAVSCPAINIGSAFAAAANAAAGMTLSPAFSPYTNSLFFLHGAYIFEPTGASAYLGGVPALANNLTYVEAAAGIYGVEAVHTGIVDTLLYQSANMELPYNVTVAEFIQAIADTKNKLTSSMSSFGITAMSNGAEVANLVPVDTAAMIVPLTPKQVVSIVTLGSTNGMGGFFPMGLNGYNFATATSTAG